MGSIGIIGGADGPTTVIVSNPDPMTSFISGVVVGVLVSVAVTLAFFGIIKLVKKNKKK